MNKMTKGWLLLISIATSINALGESVPVLQSETQLEIKQTESLNSDQADTKPEQKATGLSELYFMVQELQSQVQQLRGQLEEQAYQIKKLKSQGLTRYRDLDGRILQLQKKVNDTDGTLAANRVTPSVKPNVAITPNVATKPEALPVETNISQNQQRDYDRVFSYIKTKEFDKAIAGFHEFIKKYPSSDLTGNAYYWLGEIYLVVPDKLEQAKESFTIVVASFPKHRKAPDAMFKLGVTYDRLKDQEKAKTYLNDVQTKYPGTSAARLAAQYLKKMK